jgi:hypothetical protein
MVFTVIYLEENMLLWYIVLQRYGICNIIPHVEYFMFLY